jgi:hypothetical protein
MQSLGSPGARLTFHVRIRQAAKVPKPNGTYLSSSEIDSQS